MQNPNMMQCYNRGCGQKFNPEENKEDSCRHHPGEPVFHDAYKGWSCCNKKCTDFTEFLNIKGCTLSFHSNVKPPEPEKPKKDVDIPEVVEVKPIIRSVMKRPPFETDMIVLKPEIAPSLSQQVMNKQTSPLEKSDSTEVTIGTPCKNGGCKTTYQDLETNNSKCVFHPGYPVFHEGLKFWSCCKKRTTDFQAFLDQVGCEVGTHLWKKEGGDKNKINCRWDYHQTGTHVTVAIYAKKYDVNESVIKLNPIRLYANLIFPEDDGNFLLDVELGGIVDIEKSKVTMYGTKIEISLKKAEAGSWTQLEIPRTSNKSTEETKKVTTDQEITSRVDAVDLSDL